MKKARPNILLLVLESTPASHLSGYGYDRLTTPHLDEFASDSVLYEQAISPASWTLPSHASLFTGLYVSQHGTHFGNPYLSNDLVTLAELTRNLGYETAAFNTNDWVNEKFGFDRGFNTFRWSKRTMEWLTPLFPGETKLEKVIRYLRDPIYPIGHRNNKLLKDWISQIQRDGRPFFAYTLYYDPHYPYRPHFPYASRFLKEFDRSQPWWRTNLDPDKYMSGAVEMSPENLEVLNALYDSRLAGTDAVLGRFFDFLRQAGILDDTIVFVVADHGENLGDHGLMSHQYCVYDSLVHVPLIVRYPPLFEAGRRVHTQVQTLEIFTTIMDILGVSKDDIPNKALGRSIIPEKLEDNGDNHPSITISEYLAPNLAKMRRLYGEYDVDRYDRSLRAIRHDGYKAIFSSDGQSELYDLRADPAEAHDLAHEMPDVLQEMRLLLDGWLAQIQIADDEHLDGAEADEIDPAVIKRLQDLGYF